MLDLKTDIYYNEFVRRSLRDFQEQREPAEGLAKLTAIIRIVDGAYQCDRDGGGTADITGSPRSDFPS